MLICGVRKCGKSGKKEDREMLGWIVIAGLAGLFVGFLIACVFCAGVREDDWRLIEFLHRQIADLSDGGE